MNLNFLKIDDSHNAIEFELDSPQECQDYERAITTDIPEGMVYAVRKGKSRAGRPTLVIGLAEVGKPLTLAGDATGDNKPIAPTPIPAALEIPEVVKNADDKNLEVMAAKNGVEVNDKWRSKPRSFRNATVARGMKSMNAG